MRIVTCVGECEVWLVDLHASEAQYESALALLSDAERVRARAIRSEQARRRFALTRAALRVRLADVLGIAPEWVALRIGEHGKPELAPASLEGALRLWAHGKPEIAPAPLEGALRLQEHGRPEIAPASLEGALRLRAHGRPEIAPAPREGGLPLRDHGKLELVALPTEGEPPLREHGTPEIAPPPPRATVSAARVSQGLPQFNLAHRDGVAILAINHRGYAVGVDLERIAPESERPWGKLLERICHPCEAHEAMAEARAIGSRAFYERWVGKEAVLKALGHGLRVSPAEVPLRRDMAGVLRVGELPGRRGLASGLPGAAVADGSAAAGVDGDLARCRLATVRTPAGFVGALALKPSS
jgi:phosphopantetheinyl transferase